eukprot:Sspe_Gene.88272::Locus_60330_Transcript_1_1_Confidence_1.000_Length_365::g.88272::m.88272
MACVQRSLYERCCLWSYLSLVLMLLLGVSELMGRFKATEIPNDFIIGWACFGVMGASCAGFFFGVCYQGKVPAVWGFFLFFLVIVLTGSSGHYPPPWTWRELQLGEE